MKENDIVIISARRTPIGAFQGGLAPVAAPELGASAISAVIQDAGVKPDEVNEVVMGCVLPAGVGQAPARQAALAAGVPNSVGCTTINKVCGSGMKATMLAHDLIRAGSAKIMVAGGMESMSNAPYLMPKARAGYRMGHQQVLDHMFYDGLQNPYDGQMMGHFSELTADRYGFTREAQDEFSSASVQRARDACENGAFAAETIAMTVKTRRGESLVDRDEEPFRCDLEKIPTMRPAFRKEGGTVTAASSSSISDGAAALLIMTAKEANDRGLEPLARIVGHSGYAHEPEWFTTAPVSAVHALQEKLNWTTDDVDLYEINEAFAVVAMAAMHDLGIDHEKLNVNGGACALGHPIGATGARLIVTLTHALRTRGLNRGIASLCIGGGEATAIAIETA
ncbi:MAG: acetyl-CoA C-acyltransferase [Gammaproteobacteria bacterium]